MKKILLTLFFIGNSLFASANYADKGSKVETYYKLKVDLIKENNATVQVLDGTKYLKLNADGNSSGFGASLEAIRPTDGTYIGLKYSVTKAKQKIKLIVEGTTYYSKEFEKSGEAAYDLSQDKNDYGFTILPFGNNSTTLMFPKKLTLKKGTDAGLYFISQFAPDKVIYETKGSVESSSTIREEEILTAFLPSLPKKKISIEIIYTNDNNPKKTNTVILLLDDKDELIGGFLARPLNNIALGGNDLLKGNKNGNIYTLRFKKADDSAEDNDYFSISGTFNCANSTYSSLLINEVKDGETPTTAKPDDRDGYNLTSNGSIICKDINITE